MKKNEFRAFISITALVLSLGVLLGGYNIYVKYLVEKPLKEQLSAITAVKKVVLNKTENGYEVEVEVKKINNIQKEYIKIQNILQTKLKKEDFKLKIKDGRNESLEKLFEELQLPIYEALANNQYIWLDEEIAKKTDKNGFTYDIFIDGERLCVQLYHETHYLYEIIDRTATI